MKKDTLLNQVGRDPQRYSGAVNTPVIRASTIVFPNLESYEKRPGDNYKTPRYGIHGTPTAWALEESIAKMEGGHEAVVVPSGLAAITAAQANTNHALCGGRTGLFWLIGIAACARCTAPPLA